ncbi:phage tail spike protein [Alkalibacillus salilacus]|uniref:Phage minor structural protein n=1 Tax=Alkalibacillus salilacus TaxID=284582 RepID=A0ABT9VCV3_9BACI|nr:phage tail spike protein [Alkalibacillus salilacus]MDQ0158800.1 phage minor structural protein [Alkalibacillus salilacus]
MSQIHILDGQTDQILDVITQEYIIEDVHKQSLKDTLETFDFTTFADKRFSQYLEKRNRLIIPGEDGEYREFIMHEAIKDINSQAEVFANASYQSLKKQAIIYPQTFESQTATQMVGHATDGTEWQPGIIEITNILTFNVENHRNPFAFLKTIANEFDAELRFRVEIDGNRVTGRFVDLLERRGRWQGREVTFGKDLASIKRTEKTDNVYTALVGVGPEREDGTRLEVFVEDQDALERWGWYDKQGNLQHLIDTYEPQSTRQDMTESELEQYTQTELNKRINEVVEFEAGIIDLEHVPGLENKKIRFGDTIKIKDTNFEPPLYLEARIFEQERSIVDKSAKKVKLGDFTEFTEEEVQNVWRELQSKIAKKIEATEMYGYAEPKKIESDTPPQIQESNNPIWVDTSGDIDIPHVVIGNEWRKMTPTQANEVGAETPSGAQSKVDAVEIGGRNYALDTVESVTKNSFDGSSGQSFSAYELANDYSKLAGENVTFSFKFTLQDITYSNADDLYLKFQLIYDFEDGSTSYPTIESYNNESDFNDGEYTVETTQTVPDNLSRARISVRFDYVESGSFELFSLKTEKGNKATDWTPAPEDTHEEINQAEQNAKDYASNASNLSEGIVDVNSVPLRTAPNGARLEFDGVNGLIQYDENDNPVGWIDLDGNAHFENGYFSGEIQAETGKFAGELEGATGTFGEVTVRNGDFLLEEESGMTYKVTSENNLLRDHNFELVDTTGDVDSTHNWVDATNNNDYGSLDWYANYNPKVAVQLGPDPQEALPIFGEKALVVNYGRFFNQVVGAAPNTQYTISAFCKKQWNVSGEGALRLEVWHMDAVGERIERLVSKVFPTVPSDYSVQRHAHTFSTPDIAPDESLEVIINGGNDYWVQIDGVQMVEGNTPTVYNAENSHYNFAKGRELAESINTKSIRTYDLMESWGPLHMYDSVDMMGNELDNVGDVNADILRLSLQSSLPSNKSGVLVYFDGYQGLGMYFHNGDAWERIDN